MSMRSNQGFTLIEVLVAMAVFAVMTILAYMSLGQTLANADMLGERMDRLQAIQRTMRYLSNDLSAASPRPIRSELGDTYMPAVMVSAANNFVLAVTHGGWSNPAGLPRSTQQRSVYLLEDGKLFRVYYNVLDSTYTNNALLTEILDGVESIEFRLLQDNGETSNQWPPLGAAGLAAEIMRPRAVEIILTLEGEGEIRRIVEVAS
jgi:general secretion pathway protein J